MPYNPATDGPLVEREETFPINFKSGDIALIQADDDFMAPDGAWYRCAIGPATFIRASSLLGFEPSRSANWFLQIGYDEKAVLIAGCRIHYALPFPPSQFPIGINRNTWDAR